MEPRAPHPGRLLLALWLGLAIALSAMPSAPVAARDKPNVDPNLFKYKWLPPIERFDTDRPGMTTGQFSKEQIERFRCSVRATENGDPATSKDISCNVAELGQDFAPDNEIAIAVNPLDGKHLVAGSNAYFYRFNNATGARQAIVPTGFFTSFDGGNSWINGNIPMRSGNGAGDPSPAFVAKVRSGPDRGKTVVLMAQLENSGGQSGPWVSQGDVSVSRSPDGGITWSEPVTVMKGTGTGIGPANNAVYTSGISRG